MVYNSGKLASNMVIIIKKSHQIYNNQYIIRLLLTENLCKRLWLIMWLKTLRQLG